MMEMDNIWIEMPEIFRNGSVEIIRAGVREPKLIPIAGANKQLPLAVPQAHQRCRGVPTDGSGRPRQIECFLASSIVDGAKKRVRSNFGAADRKARMAVRND